MNKLIHLIIIARWISIGHSYHFWGRLLNRLIFRESWGSIVWNIIIVLFRRNWRGVRWSDRPWLLILKGWRLLIILSLIFSNLNWNKWVNRKKLNWFRSFLLWMRCLMRGLYNFLNWRMGFKIRKSWLLMNFLHISKVSIISPLIPAFSC